MLRGHPNAPAVPFPGPENRPRVPYPHHAKATMPGVRGVGATPDRRRGLVAAGRVPAFTLPTGSPHDRIVPVDVLMGLGSPLDSGRGRDHHLPATDARIGGVPRNAWAEAVAAAVSLTKYPNAALSLDDSQHKQA